MDGVLLAGMCPRMFVCLVVGGPYRLLSKVQLPTRLAPRVTSCRSGRLQWWLLVRLSNAEWRLDWNLGRELEFEMWWPETLPN